MAVFPQRENARFFACGHPQAVLAKNAQTPTGYVRVLAGLGLPLRTHNAVSGDKVLLLLFARKNKKTAIDPKTGYNSFVRHYWLCFIRALL